MRYGSTNAVKDDTAPWVPDLLAMTRLPLARIASAVPLGVLTVGCAVYGRPAFEILLVVAAIILAWEWTRLCERGSEPSTTVLVLLWIALAGGIAGAAFDSVVPAIGILSAGVLSVLIVSRGNLWLAAGAFYIGVPAVALVWMRYEVDGLAVVLWLLIVVWASDVGAYFVGRLLGGPKLAPRISPKKTWAGAFGGLVASVIAGGLAANLLDTSHGSWVPAISALISVVTQIGDLFESWIKRRFGVKDTSGLIPGHGGLMDRVDGLLFAAATAALIEAVRGGSILLWA